jgi:hypothetical protein
VEDRTSLHFATPENGNFLGNQQRFFCENGDIGSNLGSAETDRGQKTPVFAVVMGCLATLSAETGLGGWGVKIRTTKLPVQNLPLKVRQKLARFMPNVGLEIFTRQSCQNLNGHPAPQPAQNPNLAA